jgi:hypothetical protein
MKRLILTVIVIVAAAAALSAQQKLIPLDSPVYRELETAALRRGMAPPFDSRPWSEAEARYYYDLLDLPPHPSLRQFALLEDDGLLVNISPEVSLEGYLKTNQETAGSEYLVPWQYDYGDRLGLLNIESDVILGDGFYMGWEVDLMQENLADQKTGNPSNLALDFGYYDVNFPFVAYAAVGGDHWSASVGRHDLVLGPGYSGQLIVSDAPDWLDQLRFTLWHENFKYTGSLIYVQPYLTGDSGTGEVKEVIDWTGEDYTASKYIVFHRFDFTFFKVWNFGISEGLTWGGRPLDLRMFNPFILMHNFYEWEHAASMFSLDSEVTIARGLQAYGQFMFNAITTPYEIERYGADAEPPAMGWMAGIQYVLPATGRSSLPDLRIGLEYVHTDPWLYIRETMLTSYAWRRRALSNLEGGKPLITKPLGYIWGPDSKVFMLYADGFVPLEGGSQVDFAASLSYIQDGEQELTTPYSDWELGNATATPSGTVEHYLLLNLAPAYDLPLSGSQRLRLSLNTDLLWLKNAGHVEGQDEFDAQFALGVTWSTNR